MTQHPHLDHCIECGQKTPNRSLICDACEPEYRDVEVANDPEEVVRIFP